MSGGVDSSVAAYLLKKQGYSVIGMTFKIWPKSLCGKHGEKSCCSQEAINDARRVCEKLKIPHYVIDCEEVFKDKVINHFINSYKQGLTPNPCIICNERIKFPILCQKADEIGAKYIATGHHARCTYDRPSKRYAIREGRDKNKDQSYVLFSLGQDALSRLILPVGSYAKARIRSIAKKLSLDLDQKQESQEICFIPDNDLGRFLKENVTSNNKPGVIKYIDGKVLGKHDGTAFFTIGQRKGLKIPFGKPIYVIDIKQDTGGVIVGDYEDTLKKSLVARDVVMHESQAKIGTLPDLGSVPIFAIPICAKIRYRNPKSQASIKMLTPTTCEVTFKTPQSSPTPGQAVVFYKGDTVIGGGWIA